jgi:hypothetical protein
MEIFKIAGNWLRIKMRKWIHGDLTGPENVGFRLAAKLPDFVNSQSIPAVIGLGD